jgi:glycosyltransferase involved in cell wall biosynthesis
MAKVIIVGPAHPLRGGLATFDHRLARAFKEAGHDCSIYSFSLQYPSFLFPGTTQYSDEPAPQDLNIKTVINSINPFNWISVGRKLKAEQADIIVVRFWLPFMGPALGTILRQVDRTKSKIICIADNAVPHESRLGDKPFTQYFFGACDGFVTMSEKVFEDLKQFKTQRKPSEVVQHPLYDNFGEKVSKEAAKAHLGIEAADKLILFFGFIRKYKGLDLLLEAFAKFKAKYPNDKHKLLVAGEFYENEAGYQQQIANLGIAKDLILKTVFIPDSEVRYYLCAADVVAQPYRNATQSGVTPLAYNFEVPMVVTNVGGLPDLVPHKKAGIVAEPNATAIANALEQYYELGESYFMPHLREEKKKFSWEHFVSSIVSMAKKIQ